MGLFDLLSGWTAWAPFTLIIVGLMGYAVGAITEKHHGFGWNTLAIDSCMRDQSRWLLHCRGYHLRKTGLHRLLPFLETLSRSVLLLSSFF